MTVYAAVGFGVVEIVEAASDFAARQFAGYFDDGVGGVGDEGDGFVSSGDGLEDFDDAAAFGLAEMASLGVIFMFVQLVQKLYRPLRHIADKFTSYKWGWLPPDVFLILWRRARKTKKKP